jgi:hypothetical protein
MVETTSSRLAGDDSVSASCGQLGGSISPKARKNLIVGASVIGSFNAA